ncbi:MAG: hypothetical protein ACI9G6_001957, partial [Limisphaerales bacterium]
GGGRDRRITQQTPTLAKTTFCCSEYPPYVCIASGNLAQWKYHD